MQDLSIRISTRAPGGEMQTIDISTIPTAPALELVAGEISAAAIATEHGARFIKVSPAGNRLPAGSERTDHVAVVDNATGLMWSVESLGDPDDEDDGITQEHCIERCKQLRLLGFDDWRLPTRAELVALIDDSRHEPAIDTDLFPRVKPRWHWTGTPAAWSSASAWFVRFSYGGVDVSLRLNDGFALAVRRSGQ